MGYNKIPLALGFNDSTGNASGLVEFTLNLSDVGNVCSGTTPTTGQALVYNSDGEWCPGDVGAGTFSGNLSDVGEVCTDPPGIGESLVWNGSSWCGSAITGGGGGGSDPLVSSVNGEIGDVVLALNEISAVNSTVFNSNGDLTIGSSTGDGSGIVLYSDGKISFPVNTTEASLTEAGDVGWDKDSETLALKLNGITAHVAEDSLIRVRNQTGSLINSLNAVYVSGVQGENPAIALADNTLSQSTQRILGVTMENITNGNTGFILTKGLLKNVNTGSFTAENLLYVGTGGAVTSATPDHPNSIIRLGKVLKSSATEGIVLVEVQHGFAANEIDNITADANSVMFTTSAASVSSLSGASGSMVYFSGTSAAPSLANLASILSNEGYTIQPGETYLQNVGPDDLDSSLSTNQIPYASSTTGFAGITTTTNSRTFLESAAQLGHLSNVNDDAETEGSILTWDGTVWSPSTLTAQFGGATVEFVPNGTSLELTTSNVLLTPVGTTGKGDVDTGFIFVSGTNASSTQIVGDNFGKIWVSGPDQDISNGDYLVYFSSTTLDPGSSGTAAIQLSDNALGLLQNDTLNGTLSVIQNDTSLDTLYLEADASGNEAAPVLTFQRDSDSPDDGDYLGQIKFKGKSDTNVDRVYAKITGKTSDVSNGIEDGLIEFAIRANGSNLICQRITHNCVKIINGCGLEVDGTLAVTGNATVSNVDVQGTLDVTGNATVNNLDLDGNLTVTPSGWNQFSAAGLPVVFYKDHGYPIASSNATGSLTQVTSITIPADTISNGFDIEVSVKGRVYQQGQSLRLAIGLGGTTVLNTQISQGTNSNYTRYMWDTTISKLETNRQFTLSTWRQGNGSAGTAGNGSFGSLHRDGIMHTESTATDSGSLEMTFSVQHGANASGENFTIDTIVAKVIPTAV